MGAFNGLPARCLIYVIFMRCFHDSIAWPHSPDILRCDNIYGTQLSLAACNQALFRMPVHDGDRRYVDPDFTGHPPLDAQDIQVPKAYHDHSDPPRCEISIHVSGHDPESAFVRVSDAQIHEMADALVQECVGRSGGSGGLITYFLGDLIREWAEDASQFDSDNPGPYLVISVTPPFLDVDPGENDEWIASTVYHELDERWRNMADSLNKHILGLQLQTLRNVYRRISDGEILIWYLSTEQDS